MFMHAAPRTFVPIPGGWGRLGSTNVLLAYAKEAMVESVLEMAWRTAAPKSLLKRMVSCQARKAAERAKTVRAQLSRVLGQLDAGDALWLRHVSASTWSARRE
jgi:hypothetical protein